ncbi:hypothetical protein N44_02804 [Microcystis aeruginosa NIES-44]|uniref:Uncharacterized protein n=1 Tax=Microcystis aeruginosa NIES-44 TaxID=449439 RepID=A0A0A1VX98_MICAE|nr:hypothetical protein N44_02804 [Microcystis aeruginosa NIES-44]
MLQSTPQLPNFRGKSAKILPPIALMFGTFSGQKNLKILPNNVFRFIQPTLS